MLAESPHSNLSKILIRAQISFSLFILLMLSGLDFFFPSAYGIKAAVHGLSSIGAVIMGTFLTHRAYHLIRGVKINFEHLRNWCLGSTFMNLLGAISGNWIYMRYRGEEGPREWILANVASFHNVLMEFKEFVSLFPFPIMLGVSFALFYYGDAIHQRRDMTQFIGVTLLVSWAFLMFGFVAGLVLAKLHFV